MSCIVTGWKPSSEESVPGPSSSCPPAQTSQPAAAPRRGDPDYIKRPRNAFIIFRCEYVQEHRGTPPPAGERSKRLSKRASEAWQKLSLQKRAGYIRAAEEEKAQHARDHPGYVFRPLKKRRQPGSASHIAPARSARHQQTREFVAKPLALTPPASVSPSPVPSDFESSASDFKPVYLLDTTNSHQSPFCFPPSSTPSLYESSSLSSQSPAPALDNENPAYFGPRTPPSDGDPIYGSVPSGEDGQNTTMYGTHSFIETSQFSYLPSEISSCVPFVAHEAYPSPSSPTSSADVSSPSSFTHWQRDAALQPPNPVSWPLDFLPYPLAPPTGFLYELDPSQANTISNLSETHPLSDCGPTISPSSQYPGEYPADVYYPPSAGFPPAAFVS